MPDHPPTPGAVFLSYAREDTDAARRIADALRAFGVEVWFDQSELRGGDAWDAKIKKQIRECTMFLPIVSAGTQARGEGYFRREWKIAVERTHDMAAGVAFLLPVVSDDTAESEALVPDEFMRVQWTRLPRGVPTSQFVEQVKSLLADPRKPAISATPAPPPKVSTKSVAVLAFANLSRDPENEFFSDGISEELLNVLAKIPGLRVAARTSAFFFKGRNVPIPEIARTLGVAHVVEGSVRKSGNRVRITAQLIDAQNGFHLWSDTFDRELQDIFAVQDEIAGLIAGNLQLKLRAASRATATVNPEAHRLVLEGRHFWTLRTEAGFARAEKSFARALEIDPQFAQAHAGLADVLTVRVWYAELGGSFIHKDELKTASSEVRLALELDPSLAEAHATMGVIAYLDYRWADSEQQFQQAFRLNPNYAVAYHWHAHLLAGQGRLDAALAALERSIALDPLSFVTLVIYASQLNFAQRYEDVLVITDRAVALRSTVIAPLYSARAMALLALGRKEEAVAAARLVRQETSLWMGWWAGEETLSVLHQAGATDETSRLFHEWQASLPPDNPMYGPMLHALGDFDRALPFLEQTSPAYFSRFHYQTIWDDVRDDPRFHQLLGKLGCETEYRVGRETLARMLRERAAKK